MKSIFYLLIGVIPGHYRTPCKIGFFMILTCNLLDTGDGIAMNKSEAARYYELAEVNGN